jgi:hypothetical protein
VVKVLAGNKCECVPPQRAVEKEKGEKVGGPDMDGSQKTDHATMSSCRCLCELHKNRSDAHNYIYKVQRDMVASHGIIYCTYGNFSICSSIELLVCNIMPAHVLHYHITLMTLRTFFLSLQIADNFDMPFFEVSCKMNVNIEEAFLTLARKIREQRENRVSPYQPSDLVAKCARFGAK